MQAAIFVAYVARNDIQRRHSMNPQRPPNAPRTRIKKRIRPTVIALCVAFWVVIFIMFTVLFVSQTGTYNDLQAQLTRLRASIEAEQLEIQRREIQLSLFDSDQYVEQLARNRGMVHPNELVFRNIAD